MAKLQEHVGLEESSYFYEVDDFFLQVFFPLQNKTDNKDKGRIKNNQI